MIFKQMLLHYVWLMFQKIFQLVDYDSTDVDDDLDIHKYLTKRYDIK